MPRPGSLLAVGAICLPFIACSDEAIDSTADSGSTPDSAASVDGEAALMTLVIRNNPNSAISPFAEGSYGGADAPTISVTREGEPVLMRTSVASGDGFTALLWGLAEDTGYTAVAVGDAGASPPITFRTGRLPPELPTISAQTLDESRRHDGVTTFAVNAAGRLHYLAVDSAGQIVWYYDAGVARAARRGDLKPLDGDELLVLREGGFRVIDASGATLRDYESDWHHDVEPMPNGHFLVLRDRIENHDVPVLGGDVELRVDGIVEIDESGAEVAAWWASDHLDTQRFPGPLSQIVTPPGGHRWSHGNAIEWRDDGVALLSLRHQHWIVGIDWVSGEVAFRLGSGGDFMIDSGDDRDWFYGQHAPEAQSDGTLLVFDNGNERPGGGSATRAVRVSFDGAAGSAAVEWAYPLGTTHPRMGDADRLPNGNVLICASARVSDGTSTIFEVSGDDDPEIVWELTLDAVVYRATRLDEL